MKKVAIIIGHRSKRQGAYSAILGETEYQYMKKVAEYLSDVADIYERPDTSFGSESGRIKRMVQKVNAENYDLSLSLHFNAFSDPKANGATALFYITNKRTKAIAKEFVELMHQDFCVKRRSLIAITSKKQRGGTYIVTSKADAVLLEPFFGSNELDALAFKGKHQEYANCIKALIRKFVKS